MTKEEKKSLDDFLNYLNVRIEETKFFKSHTLKNIYAYAAKAFNTKDEYRAEEYIKKIIKLNNDLKGAVEKVKAYESIKRASTMLK